MKTASYIWVILILSDSGRSVQVLGMSRCRCKENVGSLNLRMIIWSNNIPTLVRLLELSNIVYCIYLHQNLTSSHRHSIAFKVIDQGHTSRKFNHCGLPWHVLILRNVWLLTSVLFAFLHRQTHIQTNRRKTIHASLSIDCVLLFRNISLCTVMRLFVASQ